jgi:uncharacterized membrane protein
MTMRLSPYVEKSPYVAAGYTGIASMTLNDWAMIIGIAVTVITGIINWYYKRRAYQVLRRRMENEEAMREEDIDEYNKL